MGFFGLFGGDDEDGPRQDGGREMVEKEKLLKRGKTRGPRRKEKRGAAAADGEDQEAAEMFERAQVHRLDCRSTTGSDARWFRLSWCFHF